MKDIIEPVDTDDGLFHDGDPSTGAEGTIVYAKIMNALQGGIIDIQTENKNILAEAKMKPDSSKNNQLITALKALFLVSDDKTVAGALQKSKNLSDLADINKAREVLKLDKVGNWMAVQANGGQRSSGNHQVFIDWGADGKPHLTVDASYIGEMFTTGNPPNAAQTGAYPKTGGRVDGEVWSEVGNNFRSVAGNRGVFWRFDGNACYLMFTKDGDPHGGYNALRPLIADFATGKLSAGHDFTAGGTLYAGAGKCWMATDGNVYGPVWGGYLNNWVAGQIAAQINDVRNWVYQNFVNSSRQASPQWTGGIGGGMQVPAGCVVIGARNNGSSDAAHMGLLYAAEQILINGNWMTIGLA